MKILILCQLGFLGVYALFFLMITTIVSKFDADAFSIGMTRLIGGIIGLAVTYLLTDVGLWAFGLI